MFTSRRKWRKWLETNHSRQDEIWLVLPKKSAGGDSYRVYYNEALEEALCFGWIDSRIRRLDEKRSLVRFSPRKSSNWSPGNIEKARGFDPERIDDSRWTEVLAERSRNKISDGLAMYVSMKAEAYRSG